MPVTQATYERVVLEDPEGQWELHRGRLREKPPMTAAHNRQMFYLGVQLANQLDQDEYDVRVNAGRLRRSDVTSYIPDVLVIPSAMVRPLLDRADVLESYQGPVSLVVEVWSPSTGDYDVDDKLPEYQRRGDLEIWRLHPFERTLTVWRRQPDGGYVDSLYHGGLVDVLSLPGVRIDLDAIFRR